MKDTLPYCVIFILLTEGMALLANQMFCAFQEPSIQQATQGSSAQNGLEEYDPFSSQQTTTNNTTV
ncbi:hypothetical protein SK128_019952, partial [Halocaridina rubra]